MPKEPINPTILPDVPRRRRRIDSQVSKGNIPYQELLGIHLRQCRIKNLAAVTIDGYRTASRYFLDFAGNDLMCGNITQYLINEYCLHLQSVYKPQTVNSYIAMKKNPTRRCPCQGGTPIRFVQPIILSILYEGPCHDHVILQKIAKTRLWNSETPDPAGVYRVLKDMEARGLISSYVDPDNLTERRLFELTEAGLECRKSWLKTLRQYRLGLNEVVSMLSKEPDMLSEDT